MTDQHDMIKPDHRFKQVVDGARHRPGPCRGELRTDALELAAFQFAELCKADIFSRLLLDIQSSFTEAEIALVIDDAVVVFLARYGN